MLLYYPDGTTKKVPDIDAHAHIRINGASPTPIRTTPPVSNGQEKIQQAQETPQGEIDIHTAILALINQASKIYELEPIPTVGKAAAAAIIENRPVGGYKSLDDLEPILPGRTSLESIKAWGGPEHAA